MDTNDLLHRWSTLSLAEIEDEIRRGEDQETVTQLLGAETVAEIQAVSFAPPVPGPREEVVLIPGIMGSNLASIRGVTTLLWINPLLFLQGNGRFLRLNAAGDEDEAPEVEVMPIGLEKLAYLKASLNFNRQVNLHEFPYDWRRPIEYNADVLRRSIDRWSAGDPQRKFSLVAHSMGGLVSRAYLARHGDARVARLISIASPHGGSQLARLGLGTCARQMAPGSAWLARLAAQRVTVPFVSVRTPQDNFVMPQDLQRHPDARDEPLPGVGHLAALCDARVLRLVLAHASLQKQ